MKRSERYEGILNYFREAMPTVSSELEFGNVFQLLVAVILSAQCTDKRVNMVTPELFRRFPTAKEMSKASADEIYEYIKSISYPNAKASHLYEMACQLVDEFDGEVPSTPEGLHSLSGVGRKTANVVMSVAFGQATMAVDTHVFRVSHRIGLVSSSANTPKKVEETLIKHIPEEDIPRAHHWLLLHGRYVCKSRKPLCERCPITAYCEAFRRSTV